MSCFSNLKVSNLRGISAFCAFLIDETNMLTLSFLIPIIYLVTVFVSILTFSCLGLHSRLVLFVITEIFLCCLGLQGRVWWCFSLQTCVLCFLGLWSSIWCCLGIHICDCYLSLWLLFGAVWAVWAWYPHACLVVFGITEFLVSVSG